MTTVSSRLPSARGWFHPLDYKPGPSATPDDEFRSSTLAAKWTAVSGSSGTVNPLETGNVAKYDLASRPGWLLLQAGSNASQSVLLRQDYTLPDGNSLILAVALAQLFDDGDGATPPFGIANGEMMVGLYLNSDDAAPTTTTTSGTVRMQGIETDTGIASTDFFVQSNSPATLIASETPNYKFGGLMYLRIARSGTTFYGFHSYDGNAWTPMGFADPGAAQTNVWIVCENTAAMGDPVPIQAVKFIRQGANTLDPWPLIR